MRPQDKKTVMTGRSMGATAEQVASDMKLPIEEVRSIYAKASKGESKWTTN